MKTITEEFVWDSGCLNDNGIRIMRNHGIEYCYIMQKLNSKTSEGWKPVEYAKTGRYFEADPIWTVTIHC